MPRPGIRLPLRNNPGRYLQRSRILSCELMAKLDTMTLRDGRGDKIVEAAFPSFAPAMRARMTSANLAIA